MSEKRRACRGGPRPTILQAAVCLIDELIDDGADLEVGGSIVGVSSPSRVDAVNDLYRALGQEKRPDVIDLAQARRLTVDQQLSPAWLSDAMRALIRRRTVPS